MRGIMNKFSLIGVLGFSMRDVSLDVLLLYGLIGKILLRGWVTYNQQNRYYPHRKLRGFPFGYRQNDKRCSTTLLQAFIKNRICHSELGLFEKWTTLLSLQRIWCTPNEGGAASNESTDVSEKEGTETLLHFDSNISTGTKLFNCMVCDNYVKHLILIDIRGAMIQYGKCRGTTDSVIGIGKKLRYAKKRKDTSRVYECCWGWLAKKQARSIHLNILPAPGIVGNSENQSSRCLKSRIIASRCRLYWLSIFWCYCWESTSTLSLLFLVQSNNLTPT